MIQKTDSNDSKNWFQWFQKLIPKIDSSNSKVDSEYWFQNSKIDTNELQILHNHGHGFLKILFNFKSKYSIKANLM